MLWAKIWFRISYQIIPGPIMGKDLVAIFGSGDSRAPCLFLFRFSVELRISALNDYNHLICQNIGVNVYSRFLLTIGTIYF